MVCTTSPTAGRAVAARRGTAAAEEHLQRGMELAGTEKDQWRASAWRNLAAIQLHLGDSEVQIDPDSDLEITLAKSFVDENPEVFDPDHDGVRTYNLLALSGGGSNGAFGSGLLCGWTTAGTRPVFKVVTGVSTGALQATAAFLGPKYDYILKDINYY